LKYGSLNADLKKYFFAGVTSYAGTL